MRVLVTVNDAFGHVLPLVPTIHALAQLGHDVLVACPGSAGGVAKRDRVECRQYGSLPLPPVAEPPSVDDRAARMHWAVGTSWPNHAHGWVDALLSDARAWRPDVVIVEPVEHAGRVVAATLYAPLVEHGWGFSLPDGADHTAGEGLANLYSRFGATWKAPDVRVDLGAASVQAADHPANVGRYRYVAWSPPSEPLPAPDERPRVLVTLGTFPNPSARARLRAAVESASALKLGVVVALGNDDREPDAEWPPGVTTARWLDLPAEVARCALVVHHGGPHAPLTCENAEVQTLNRNSTTSPSAIT